MSLKIFNKYKKSFFILFTISFFYILPLILANFYFIDDLVRINYPGGWKSLGRPFADILFHIIGVGSFIDLFPLTLILSCIFISLTSLLLIKRLSLNPNNFISYLIVLPILCSPLYLENLSYRNDNALMTLALLFSIFSVSLTYKSKYIFLLRVLLLFIALGLYQISLNVFFALTFLFFIHDYNSTPSKSLKILTQSILICIISYLIYYILIVKLYLQKIPDQYMNNMSQTISLDRDGILKLFKNFKIIISYFNENFKKTHLILSGILFILSYYFIIKILNQKTTSKQNISLIKKIILLLSPIIIFLCIPGLLLLMKNLSFHPRMLIASSTFLIFLFYSLYSILKNDWKYLLMLPYIYFFSLMYSYGSSLAIMKTYNEYLITQINHDLYKLGIKDNDNVYIFGYPSLPNQIEHFINKNKFTTFFFHANRINGNVNGGAGFVTNGLFHFHNLKINMPILKDNNYIFEVQNAPNINQGIYKIYKNNNDYVIWFP